MGASVAAVEIVGDLRGWHQGHCDWSDMVSSVDTTRVKHEGKRTQHDMKVWCPPWKKEGGIGDMIGK